MITLVAGYEVLGDRRYLDTAIAYGDYLLGKQMPNGFWASGYGTVYLADTGSALGLFIVLYRHVDRARQKRYFEAVERYVNSLLKDKMIVPNGLLNRGAEGGAKVNAFNTVTSLTGRALADIISPGVDARW